MNLFDVFSKEAPNKVFFSIFLGMLSGISNAFLIPVLLSAISIDHSAIVESESSVRTVMSFEVNNYKIATLFLLLCIFILITRTLSQVVLSRVSINLTMGIRNSLYKKIMDASIDMLENMGSSKLIAAINTDVERIIAGSRVIPDLLINIVTIIGLLGFLMYLNINVFGFVLVAIILGTGIYQLLIMVSKKYFEHVRKKVDDLQKAIHGLIYGAKELKLNGVKSQAFFKEELVDNELEASKSDKTGDTIVRIAINYGDMISFIVIGIVTFIFVNYEAVSNEELIGLALALLYITGPIAFVVNAIPTIMVARISLNKVNGILDEIPPEKINQSIDLLEPWDKIHFSQVCYQYKKQDLIDGFKVGPVDFTIDKSAITFIVGGNGSGKSTLSKLISLHYLPKSGLICFDNTHIDESNLKSYRQSISSIYSDYYLFDSLLNVNHLKKKEEIDFYLKELDLNTKVTIDHGRFSTIALSDGQKRRLALLVALLEDRELYLFDEWAADQDPMFKEFFYHYILTQLKNKGKAVVVISHDDRYFNIADKILVMENGMIIDCITDSETINQRTLRRTILSGG